MPRGAEWVANRGYVTLARPRRCNQISAAECLSCGMIFFCALVVDNLSTSFLSSRRWLAATFDLCLILTYV
jgi:hypothetical protein